MTGFNETEINSAKETFETQGFGANEGIAGSIKESAAVVLATFNKIPTTAGPEVVRLVQLAKTNLEQAIMWATKACSRAH